MEKVEAIEKRMLIAKYLPQTEPKLVLFVAFSQALDLRNEPCCSPCPSDIEERIAWAGLERPHAVGIQKVSQSIQGLGMAPIAPIHQVRVDDERVLRG